MRVEGCVPDPFPYLEEADVFVQLFRFAMAGALALSLCPQSHAQDWPQRPLKIMVIAAPGANPLPAVARLVHDSGWEVDELHVERGRLDEVFRDITREVA